MITKPSYSVQDIEFNAEGTILRGWLYQPTVIEGQIPAIVMAHGYKGVGKGVGSIDCKGVGSIVKGSVP